MFRPLPAQCLEWHVDINEVPFCPCHDCMPPCPVEEHEEQLENLIESIIKTQAGIIRLRAHVIARPHVVSCRVAPRIYKKLLLRTSLKLYDAGFWTYVGPVCTCPNLIYARVLLQRLHNICVIAGVDPRPLFSFCEYDPTPIM